MDHRYYLLILYQRINVFNLMIGNSIEIHFFSGLLKSLKDILALLFDIQLLTLSLAIERSAMIFLSCPSLEVYL